MKHPAERTAATEQAGRAIPGQGGGAPAAGKPRRRRRWLRRVIIGGLLLATLAVGGGAFLMRGPAPGWVVARLVRESTACEFRAADTHINLNGALVIEGLLLRSPMTVGPGGDVLRADRVVVDLDWSGWASLDIRPRGVEIVKPVVRISQDSDGRINLAAIRPAGGAGAGAGGGGLASRMPHVRVSDALIELGEHTREGFSLLARLPIEGSVTPIGDGSAGCAIRLKEQLGPGAAADSGVSIEGTVDLGKGEARAKLSGLALNKWTPETVPGAFRRAWRELALDGRVAGAEVEWTRQNGIEGRMLIQGISMSLPIPSERSGPQAASRVRMHEVTGVLKVGQGGLAGGQSGFEAALSGKIEDLPCRINLRTYGLDPDTATIDCEVLSEGFEMSKTWALRAFAPELVLQRLAQFSGPTALVDARTKVRRENGKWSYNGTVQLRDGRAAFEQFPYPFFDIAGRVEFDDEKVRIVGLTGRGLTGARMVATGEIWPPDDGTYVDIRVDVRNAPADEVLAAAVDRRTKLAEAVLWRSTLDEFRRNPTLGPSESVFDRLLGPEWRTSLLGGERTWRMGLYQALFSREDFVRQTEAGLILDPAAKPDLVKELATARAALGALDTGAARADEETAEAVRDRVRLLEKRLAAPEFSFGGMIDQLVVTVKRSPETGGHYDTDIELKLRSAGMVPEPFPLPVLADNLLVKVRENALEFEGRGFRALRGGVATVTGHLDLTDPERTAKVPNLHVDARGLAVDDLLFQAIPERMGRGERHNDEEGLQTASAPDVLRALNPSGQVDCVADVRQLDDGRTGFDVRVAMRDLTAAPRQTRADLPQLRLAGLSGDVHVTQDSLQIEGLTARVGLAAGDGGAGGGEGGEGEGGRLKLSARTLFTQAAGPAGSLRATIDAEGVDLSWPLEDLVGPVSSDAALKLAQLRAEHNPAGLVDARVEVTPSISSAAGEPGLRVSADVRQTTGLAFDVLGGRLTAEHHGGGVGIVVDRGPNRARADVTFSEARADLAFDGSPAGRVEVSGPIGVTPEGKLAPRGELTVVARGALIESELTRRMLGASVSPRLQAWMGRSEVGGEFDGEFRLAAKQAVEGAGAGAGGEKDASAWWASGQVRPRSLRITQRGVVTTAPAVSGWLDLAGPEVRLNQLRVSTGEWSMQADGPFVSGGEGEDSWRLDLQLSGKAASLEPTLLSLLPVAVDEGLKSSSVRVDHGFDLLSGKLMLAGRTTDAEPVARASFEGELQLDGLSADAGVALTEGAGRLVVVARLPEGRSWSDVRLDLTLAKVRAAGIALTDAGAVITTGRTEGEVIAPVIRGRSAGGVVSGAAFIRPRDPAAGPGREYGARFEVGGVRLGELITDLSEGGAEGPKAGPVERGQLTGDLSITGVSGSIESRRGRGSMVIAGGDVLGVPLMAPMLELSNLIPPMGDKLNHLEGTFYLIGPLLTFERIQLQSSTVEVVGGGTMTVPGMELDLRFNSRGRARVPLWSDLLEGLRDEVITTRVRGTLREPKFGSESLSGARRMLSGIFGPEADDEGRGGGVKAGPQAVDAQSPRPDDR